MELKQTVTNVIGEDYKKWTSDKIIMIEAGTGKGKSHFIKYELYDYCKKLKKKILLLSNRTNLLNQNISELSGKEDVITCMNYQKIDWQRSHNSVCIDDEKYIDLNDYDYIVCDECHYFFTDAQFNNFTDISFNNLLDSKPIKIFMSATPRLTRRYISDMLGEDSMIQYKLLNDYSYIDNLYIYKDSELIEKILLKELRDEEKVIYFCQKAKDCYRLATLPYLEDISLFLCSKSHDLYRYVDKQQIEKMLKNEKFDKQILFTTACLDNGINIKDRAIKHIIIDMKDIDTLIQCLGRKRILDNDDKVNVYIKNISNMSLGGIISNSKNKIAIADELLFTSTKEFIENHPKPNLDNIIYLHKSGELKINNMIYTKTEDRIELSESLLNNEGSDEIHKKYPYAMFISTYLNKKWRLYDNMNSLKTFEEYLESQVGIRLFKDGQSELKIMFEKAGLKDRTMGINTLNGKLQDMELEYKIISKKVKVDGKLHTVWIIMDRE